MIYSALSRSVRNKPDRINSKSCKARNSGFNNLADSTEQPDVFFSGNKQTGLKKYAVPNPFQAVVHTHWDMEWYKTQNEYKFRLIGAMDQLLDWLETGKLPNFTLDGHTLPLETYLELRPENKGRIKKLVQAGKLSVGPWYVLGDEFLVSGESIIRNLQLGIKDARSFGQKVFTGYTPDTFGHSADLPMLLKQFGMDTAMVGRGVQSGNPWLKWKAPSGDTVLTYHLVDGYQQKLLNRRDRDLKFKHEQFKPFLDLFKQITPPSMPILYPLGADHILGSPAAVRDLKKIVKGVDFVTMVEFMRKAKKTVNPAELREVQGEMRYAGKGRYLLQGVLSSRPYLKQKNHELEWKLARQLEQLISWEKMLGIAPRKYEKELETQWRSLLKNQPHDSITGCSIDEVHRENEMRFQLVEEYTNAMINNAHDTLQKRLQPDGAILLLNLGDKPYRGVMEIEQEYTRWNERLDQPQAVPTPHANSQVLSEELVPSKTRDERDTDFPPVMGQNRLKRKSLIWVDHLPAHGVLRLNDVQAAPESVSATPATLENAHLKVTVNQAEGKLAIINKATGKAYEGIHELWRNREQGDSYNAAPVPGAPREKAVLESVTLLTQGRLRGALKLSYRFQSINLPVESIISLDAGSRELQFETSLNNNTPDHKIQAVFKTDQPIRSVTAEGHFSPVQRSYDPNYHIQEHMPASDRELPVSGGPIQRFVGLTDQTLATKGLTEYEVEDNELRLTLLRAFGYLSRPDTGTRAGSAGPTRATPDGQCQGCPLSFKYSWAPRFDLQRAFDQSDRLYGSVYGFDKQDHSIEPGYDPAQPAKVIPIPDGGQSFFTWDNRAVQASATFPADENRNLWQLRLVNPTPTAQTLTLQFARPTSKLSVIDLTGRVRQKLKIPQLTLPPYQIATIQVEH